MGILLLILQIIALCYAMLCLYKIILQHRNQSCYLLAYQCFKPPEETRLDTNTCVRICKRNKNLGIEEYRFLLKAISNCGIGDKNTYAPRSLIEGKEECGSVEDGLIELDEIMFGTLDSLFKTTAFSPLDIDILVVSVTIFCSVSSFAARIINRYKLRDDIKAYNLSGMGCTGSIVAIDLVQNLFKTHKNSLAIVLSTECLSQSWYCGKVKSMMLSNCIFRSGGCSILLTNKPSLKHQAILKLKHLERTHLGANDEAYESAILVEDDQGHKGIFLDKNIPEAASEALKLNLKVVVPRVLPIWEILCYFILKKGRIDFKSGVEHFCVHPGGRRVVDEIGKGLGLNDYDLEPSRMTIHQWGNTNSSGVWYVLGYMEAKKRLKKWDRILMIGLGSGFKCCTCVWEVMKDLDGANNNVWKDFMDSLYVRTNSWANHEALEFVKES